MKKEDLTNLTNDELLQQEKKTKPNFRFFFFAYGLMVGVAIINTINKGLGVFTFLPIVFSPILFNNWNKYKSVKKEKEIRNLN